MKNQFMLFSMILMLASCNNNVSDNRHTDKSDEKANLSDIILAPERKIKETAVESLYSLTNNREASALFPDGRNQKISKSIAKLFLIDNRGTTISTCSGFLISDTEIATASHCITRDVSKIIARFGHFSTIADENKFDDYIIKKDRIGNFSARFDPIRDVAVLEIDIGPDRAAPGRTWGILPIRNVLKDEVIDTSVRVFHYPTIDIDRNPIKSADECSDSTKCVQRITNECLILRIPDIDKKNIHQFKHLCPTSYGSSGAPVIDRDSSVVGMHIAIQEGTSGVSVGELFTGIRFIPNLACDFFQNHDICRYIKKIASTQSGSDFMRKNNTENKFYKPTKNCGYFQSQDVWYCTLRLTNINDRDFAMDRALKASYAIADNIGVQSELVEFRQWNEIGTVYTKPEFINDALDNVVSIVQIGTKKIAVSATRTENDIYISIYGGKEGFYDAGNILTIRSLPSIYEN